jgi:hypothetical protein
MRDGSDDELVREMEFGLVVGVRPSRFGGYHALVQMNEQDEALGVPNAIPETCNYRYELYHPGVNLDSNLPESVRGQLVDRAGRQALRFSEAEPRNITGEPVDFMPIDPYPPPSARADSDEAGENAAEQAALELGLRLTAAQASALGRPEDAGQADMVALGAQHVDLHIGGRVFHTTVLQLTDDLLRTLIDRADEGLVETLNGAVDAMRPDLRPDLRNREEADNHGGAPAEGGH